MLSTRQFKKSSAENCSDTDLTSVFFITVLALITIAGSYFFYKRKIARPVAPGKKMDIEIRYDTEKDADSTMLAQNLVKIIRIVLSPLESKIAREEAKLVFVFGGDSWEIRVKNGSAQLKNAIRKILEAKEW